MEWLSERETGPDEHEKQLKSKGNTLSLQYASHEKLTNRRGLQRFLDV